MKDIDIIDWLRREAELVALDRLNEAADTIARLRAALEEILPIADGPARPLQGLAIATIARKALGEK